VFATYRNGALLAFSLVVISSAQDDQTFRSNVELVAVPFSVVDTRGVAVSNLTRDELRVYSDDIRLPIANLWIDDNLPLTVGVIIDSSESQDEYASEHRLTAARLLRQILRPSDRFFVISVDEAIRLSVDLTKATADPASQMIGATDAPLIESCTNRKGSGAGFPPVSACGSSRLWDAVYDAALLKMQPLTGNKAVLILTDGLDIGSAHTWRQAADAANHADVSVYAIKYRSPFGLFAPDLLDLVAEAGGTLFQAPDGHDEEIISRLESDLRRRYVVGFRPNPLMSYKVRHKIRIEVTRPELTVRSRKTYLQDPR
jgi:VWFA-related protein